LTGRDHHFCVALRNDIGLYGIVTSGHSWDGEAR
jgi:hypothetical protein